MPYAGLRTTFKAKNLAQLLRHCSFGLREATLWPSPYSPIHKEFIAQLIYDHIWYIYIYIIHHLSLYFMICTYFTMYCHTLKLYHTPPAVEAHASEAPRCDLDKAGCLRTSTDVCRGRGKVLILSGWCFQPSWNILISQWEGLSHILWKFIENKQSSKPPTSFAIPFSLQVGPPLQSHVFSAAC